MILNRQITSQCDAVSLGQFLIFYHYLSNKHYFARR
jgi:hypothetical protein